MKWDKKPSYLWIHLLVRYSQISKLQNVCSALQQFHFMFFIPKFTCHPFPISHLSKSKSSAEILVISPFFSKAPPRPLSLCFIQLRESQTWRPSSSSEWQASSHSPEQLTCKPSSRFPFLKKPWANYSICLVIALNFDPIWFF